MTDLERQLTDHLRRRAAAASPRFDLEAIYRDADLPYQLDVEQPHPAPRHRRRWMAVGVAAAVTVIAALGAIASRDDGTTNDVTTSSETPADPLAGHWFAFAAEDSPTSRPTTVIDVYLLRDSEPPRRVVLPGSNTRHEVCPAFSPTGSRRLMIGRIGDQEPPEQGPELVIAQVERDGSVTPQLTIPLEELGSATPAQPQDEGGIFRLRSGPCAIWSPDGNWAALGGGGAVWVVNTNTGEVRQLPGYHPTDLEWRPGTDELAITGKQTALDGPATDAPVDIHTASTGQTRTLGTARATHLTWSPDGTTLAFTHGPDQPDSGIWLVDADGTYERQLTEHLGVVGHGTGVTWSPDGELIAYQRWCGERCGEGDEVVLVTANDQNADAPIGTETVIPPPRTRSRAGLRPWYPWHVTWSPDATHLVYHGWQDIDGRGPAGLLAVPIQAVGSPIVISDDLGIQAYDGTPWVPLQPWGPR